LGRLAAATSDSSNVRVCIVVREADSVVVKACRIVREEGRSLNSLGREISQQSQFSRGFRL